MYVKKNTELEVVSKIWLNLEKVQIEIFTTNVFAPRH